jgi:hypothetical protein
MPDQPLTDAEKQLRIHDIVAAARTRPDALQASIDALAEVAALAAENTAIPEQRWPQA